MIQDFIKKLSSFEFDMLILAIQELESMGSSKCVEKMDAELKAIVHEIDIINQTRELLTAKKEIFAHALKVLDKEDAPIDIQLLRQCLESHYNELTDRIVETRPTELLAKKHRLARRIREMEQVSMLGKMIRDELK